MTAASASVFGFQELLWRINSSMKEPALRKRSISIELEPGALILLLVQVNDFDRSPFPYTSWVRKRPKRPWSET